MLSGAQQTQQDPAVAWARQLDQRVRAHDASLLPALRPAVSAAQNPAPDPTKGTGHDRALLDGVTIDRPLEMVPTFLTNLVEHVTGSRDERSGKALTQMLLAGGQLVQAGLRSMSQGTGAVATGSSILGKVLPVVGIASGAMQIWKGWNELQSHDGGPLSLIHSRTARTGMLQVLAGALLFVPGVGPALGGAATRMVAAANELDAFHALDWPTVPVEAKGAKIAHAVHPFDETPTVARDRTPDRD